MGSSLHAVAEAPRAQRSVGRRSDGVSPSRVGVSGVILLLVAAPVFSKTQIAAGVSLGDAAFACAVGLASVSLLMTEGRVYVQKRLAPAIAILVWATFSGFMAAATRVLPFSFEDMLTSFAKLALYVLGSLILAAHVRWLPIASVRKMVMRVILAVAFLSFYSYLGAIVSLPGADLLGSPGSGADPFLSPDAIEVPRAQGLFGEPAYLGIYLVMFLGFLMLTKENRSRTEWAVLAFGLAMVVMTFSFSAYALVLLFVAGVIVSSQGTPRRRRRLLLATTFATVLSIILLVGPLSDFASVTLFDRLNRVSAGEDNSANVRLLASWETPLRVVGVSPVYGTGIGNLGASTLALDDLRYAPLLKTLGPEESAHEGWNMFAWVVGSMGLVGLALLIWLVVPILLDVPAFGALLIGLGFASGSVLDPLLWTSLILFGYGCDVINRRARSRAQ